LRRASRSRKARSKSAYARKVGRETEAEAVAFVVSSAIGLDGDTASDYVRLHGGDTATLAESLAFVQKTAAEIIATLRPRCHDSG